MKVLQVNKLYPPHIGGIEFHLRDLAEGLAAREDRSFVVEVLCAAGAPRSSVELINGVKVRRLPSYGELRRAPICPRLPWEMRRVRADVMHLHFPSPPAEAALLLPRKTKPVVITFHAEIFGRSVVTSAYAPFVSAAFKRADRIIVTSPAMAERSPSLRDFQAKLRVVPLGIDTGHFAATPSAVEAAERLRRSIGGESVVLFVGRFVASKGIEVLVRSFAHLVGMAGMHESRLVLVGSGAGEASIRELSAELGIAEKLVFAASVSNEELPVYMRMADVLVLPSVTEQEAFGLVQVEAMASGTPVICTDLPTGVPWVNADGETGLVVPVGDDKAMADALHTMLSDDSLRTRMGSAALKRAVELFDVSKMVDGVIGVYDEVVGG